jgi:hypothetical protein
VSFVAALAVADMLGEYVPASLVSLKWPNDPLLGGLKVSGILVESGASPAGGLWIAVGIGVNLRRKPIDSERPPPRSPPIAKAPPPSPIEAIEVLAGRSSAGSGRLDHAWASRHRRRLDRPRPWPGRGLRRAPGDRNPGRHRRRAGRRRRAASSSRRRPTSPDHRRRRLLRRGLMLLAIEQGNTNTMFAIHDGASWVAQWRAATESTRTADEYVVWLSQLLSMQGLGFRAIDAVIISSVVPQSIFNLRNLSRRYFNVEPIVIGENAKLGVDVRIDKPSEAGADRLVNAVGAGMVYPGPLIVIDSGTATTFDIVAADGAFEGGIIAPGSIFRCRPCTRRRPSCRASPSSARPVTGSWAPTRCRPCSRACFGGISP